MKNFLRAPDPNVADQYEAARFRLTWNVNVILSFALLLLTVVSAVTQSEYAIIYGIALLACGLATFYMFRLKDYRLIALVLSLLFYTLVLYSYFSVDGYIHFLEPFWAVVIIIYIYFIRGKILGGIALLINIVATALFFNFRLENAVTILENVGRDRLFSMSLEFAICMLLIGYLIHQFIDANLRAEQAQRDLNQALIKEKKYINKQNDEKTVLLQEIHHRVKNNLQIITSLLRMQSEKVDSEETKRHFQDAINRVLTMSLVHQKLYENKSLSEVDLSEYVEALCSDILHINENEKTIKRHLNVHCHCINTKTLVPLGLIITELISNSMKHAFTMSKNEPEIHIDIDLNETDEILYLSYRDNGTWKAGNSSSFGLQLIETFTEQLEGSVSRTIDQNGTSFSFVLRNQRTEN